MYLQLVWFQHNVVHVCMNKGSVPDDYLPEFLEQICDWSRFRGAWTSILEYNLVVLWKFFERDYLLMTAIWKFCSGMPWISKNNSPKPSPTSHLSEVLTPIDPYLVWVRQGRPRGIFVGWKLWFVGGIRLKSWWICRGIFNILYKWLKTGLDWILRSVLKGFSVLNDHDFARDVEGAVLLSTPGESSHQTIMSRLQGTLVFERESFKHIMCIYIQYVPVLLACWCVLEISRLHLLFSTFSSLSLVESSLFVGKSRWRRSSGTLTCHLYYQGCPAPCPHLCGFVRNLVDDSLLVNFLWMYEEARQWKPVLLLSNCV